MINGRPQGCMVVLTGSYEAAQAYGVKQPLRAESPNGSTKRKGCGGNMRIIIYTILTFMSLNLWSMEPGDWQLGGSVQIEKHDRGNRTDRNLYLRPEAHRYFSPRLGAGVAINYSKDLNETKTHRPGIDILGTLVVLPGRYNPYARTGPSFLKAWIDGAEWYSEIGWYSEVGVLYELTEHVYLNPNYSYRVRARHYYSSNSNNSYIEYNFKLALSIIL